MITVSGISFVLLEMVQSEGIIRLDFSGWLPPFGILFVADTFALLLVLTASIVTTICLLYAFSTIGVQNETMFFYPFVMF
ncbi:cation:proton antiporter, partial [Paraburkholderia sp. SIMBA_027]